MASERLAAKWGPIFQITNQGHRRIIVSSVELVDKLCNEEVFCKAAGGGAALPRQHGPAGLFSALNESEDWAIAHRVLMPTFGPLSIEGLFDGMHGERFGLEGRA